MIAQYRISYRFAKYYYSGYFVDYLNYLLQLTIFGLVTNCRIFFVDTGISFLWRHRCVTHLCCSISWQHWAANTSVSLRKPTI